MRTNITLIGMPGAGKSTVGIILAKILSFDFIDTDILIQLRYKKTLQQIIDEKNYICLRRIEKLEILRLNPSRTVIATGGSAVYEAEAMTHLKQISYVVFLKVGYDELKMRIHNFDSRGIAKAKNQTFLDLYHERNTLYKKYADFTIKNSNISQENAAQKIANYVRELH